ncbi:MAG: SDR family NAD(P)-dependent oxidoreductase [Eubacteriales bacterium]|nr:SDR family NAD(P)-dependent oxidoreductase [Eubacteriales bacterium]
MKEFNGKVALVTGAAHGIGYAFSKEAAERGMKLALVDIDEPALNQVAEELRSRNAEVLVCVTDVSVYEEAKASVQATMEQFGQIDVLFANAGIATAGSILTIPIRDWEWAMAVNTMGIVHYVHEVLPIMEAQKTPAHLMCTASIAGLRAGMAVNPPYFASKHAAVSVAESVKAEVESTGCDIGVSVFCPMYVATDIHNCEKHRPARFWDASDPFYRSEEYIKAREAFRDNVTGGMPLDNIGKRLFQAIEDNQMYIVTHTQTIPYIEERHRAIEADAKKELELS